MDQILEDGNGDFLLERRNRRPVGEVALTDDGKAVSGMGSDFRDYDNDGRPVSV